MKGELKHFEWGFGQPNGQHLQKCLLYVKSLKGYDDEECLLKVCPYCQFEQDTYFKLKGICNGNTVVSLKLTFFKIHWQTKKKILLNPYLISDDLVDPDGLLGINNLEKVENMFSFRIF